MKNLIESYFNQTAEFNGNKTFVGKTFFSYKLADGSSVLADTRTNEFVKL